MLLAIDAGNTSITFGIFDNENLIKTFRLPSDKELLQQGKEYNLAQHLDGLEIEDCIIGSVKPELNDSLKQTCDKILGIDSLLYTSEMKTGVTLNLKHPEEVGADRIANAAGAIGKYKNPLIIVDLGTATTFDIISPKGEFIGGVIMPGLNLQFKSLNLNTSKLPRIEADISEKAIGDCTVNALLSGVIRGSACAIEGLLNQCELELGEKANIVATGGYCELLSKYMLRKFDYVNPSLTLEGLKYLWEINCKILPCS